MRFSNSRLLVHVERPSTHAAIRIGDRARRRSGQCRPTKREREKAARPSARAPLSVAPLLKCESVEGGAPLHCAELLLAWPFPRFLFFLFMEPRAVQARTQLSVFTLVLRAQGRGSADIGGTPAHVLSSRRYTAKTEDNGTQRQPCERHGRDGSSSLARQASLPLHHHYGYHPYRGEARRRQRQ